MPILITSVIGWPSAPARGPRARRRRSSAFFPARRLTSGITSLPSTRTGLPSKLRRCLCRTARFSVVLIFSPANIASRLASTLATLASSTSALRMGLSMRCLEIIEQEIVQGDAELREPRRIVREIFSCGACQHALAHAGEFRQCRQCRLGRHSPFLIHACL